MARNRIWWSDKIDRQHLELLSESRVSIRMLSLKHK